MQLFRGSPTPVTVGGVECVPFKTSAEVDGRDGGDGDGVGEREVWDSGCGQDPTSPLYRRCAVEVDQESRPTRTGYCAKPTENMKVCRRKLRAGAACTLSWCIVPCFVSFRLM